MLDTHKVNQDVVLGYWDQVLNTEPADLQAWIDAKAAGIRIPCLAVFGRPATDGERERLGRLPDAQIEEWAGRRPFRPPRRSRAIRDQAPHLRPALRPGGLTMPTTQSQRPSTRTGCMHAIRGRHAYDGESFFSAGATVLVEDGLIIGVEPYGFQVPRDCLVTGHEGTLLPGLIDAHTHLVADRGASALDRVAGYSAQEIDEVISRALRDQLLAGVTTVRDLGDRRYCVLDRRDRQQSTPAIEPTIVASGPPVTSKGGHCHYMGGEVSGTDEIIGAVAERVERGADIIKVMASGGVNTPGTDVMRPQFTTGELQLIVERAHAAGVAVTAHAHGTPAVEQAVAVGVDGIEHCSCVTDRGFGQVSEETVVTLARSRIAVCPTIGVDAQLMKAPPPAIRTMMARMAMTAEHMLQARWDFVGRLHRAGVHLGIGGRLGHRACQAARRAPACRV